jgi:hypothetical protein
VRGLLPLLLLSLALAPASGFAQDGESPDVEPEANPDEAPADPPADTPEVAPAPAPRVDALGRPFPDPKLLARARGQTVGGITMAGVGGAALVAGLFVGSSVARGDVRIGTAEETGVVLGATFGTGLGLLAAGIPLASTGSFTSAQLTRTIKGAEKVPRTVANEALYWDYYGQRQIGQTLTVSGGGAVLMGVVATAAAVAIVDSDFYKPGIWAGVGGAYGGGALLIVLGAVLQKDADARMDALSREVDPYYREQASLPPRLRPLQIDRRELVPMVTGSGVSLSFRF